MLEANSVLKNIKLENFKKALKIKNGLWFI